MNTYIQTITNGRRSTPVKVFLWHDPIPDFPNCRVFHGQAGNAIVLGQWNDISPILQSYSIADYVVECTRRNSAVDLLSYENLNARIEPGAILRQGVTLGERVVVMMGAVLNIGVRVGADTMIDMNAVLGGGAQVGSACHIGAGAVLAGMVEPACCQPVTVEDRVLVGANAVILEGIRVGHDSVVAAGAVVTKYVPPFAVVGGCPAKILKWKDEKTVGKTSLTDGLR